MRGWKLRYIGIAYFYGVPMYSFFGYIGIKYYRGIPMYLEYMVLCTYIGNARLRAFPMYYCQNKIHRNSGFSSNPDVSPRIYHVISEESPNIRTPVVHISYRIPQQDRKERSLQVHPLFQPLFCARVCHLNRTYCPQG